MDATVGHGGHAAEILRRSSPDGRLWGIDRDPQALALSRAVLTEFGGRVRLGQGRYDKIAEALPDLPRESLDGALADLGVSTMQLLDPTRGFSFQREGPLDMRMDPTKGETAAAYLARVTPAELEQRLSEAGEERFAKKLAPRLAGKDWPTTLALAEAVTRMIPRRGKTHPATRVFMALRLAVNQEMEALKAFLEVVPAYLRPGARLVVITFHSLEDGIVKRFYKRHATMKAVSKSPQIPSWDERRENPRSRSAKMRVFEKQI
jgi:16S rRNA (cytosine1402-N4)-methyltransferase